MIRAAVLFAILALPVLAQGLPPPVSLLSQTVWREDLPGFGGFSGLMVAPGGESFLAVTDRGVLARARLERNGSGLVTGIALERFEPLVTPLGRPLGRYATDAEDLAPGEDGGLYISFEGEHRLRWYPAPHARPRPRPGHPDFAGLQTNSGLESIARDPEGRIIAIPERSGAETRPFPVYRWDGRRWTIPYRLPRRGGFLPTSADFDDRGRLYLLERSFAIFSGFTTRIRRFSFDGDAITGEETLLESAPNAYDNAEGLSLWRTAEGDLRMTLISDDNFQFLQRTVVSEFAVQE